MIEKLSDSEKKLMETFWFSQAQSECLFSNFDNLAEMENEKLAHVRLGQIPLLSHEYILAEDPHLSEKENFKLKKNVGDGYAFGGRLYGKSLCLLKLDMLISFVLLKSEKAGFTSYDAIHIRGILEDVISALDYHPFFRIFKAQITRSPNYRITFPTGYILNGINMNIESKSPGKQFFQHHLTRLFADEMSFESETVYKQRRDSISELGCVERFAGMTLFTKYTPCIYEEEYILYPDFTSKKIKDVQIGDIILGWDERKFKFIESKVLNKINSGVKDVIQIRSNLHTLYLTPEHKIFTRYEKNLHYYWQEAVKCSIQDHTIFTLPYIVNYENYLRGTLIGLIESDGSRIALYPKKEKSPKFQYFLYQSDQCELDYVLEILKYYNFKYTTTLKNNDNYIKYFNKKANGKNYNFSISRKHSDFIDKIYNDLESDKDVQYGYLAGFVIGDGWIDYWANFIISQKKDTVKDILLQKIFKLLKLRYTYSVEENNQGRYKFQGYSIPFNLNSHKSRDYKLKIEKLFKTKEKDFYKVRLNNFKSNVQVYDLTTTTGNFIANGFIVHNCGALFYDLSNKNKIINYPQYVNPRWDEKSKEKALKDFGGESSLAYRIFIKGEVVEDGISAFDMQRIRCFYDEDRKIKNFEINKENFLNFENFIFLEKPRNTDLTFISADIGESAPTEITIIFKMNKIYRYEYNITLFNLTDKEQFQVFKWLGEKLEATYIALDTSEGTGRAIFRSLEEVFPRENLVWVAFTEKIQIDFERHPETKEVMFLDGKPVYKEEFVSEWSVKHLRDLLYNGSIGLPVDFKLDKQLNSVIAFRSKSSSRTIYQCANADDHLFQSFQVFSISEWLHEFMNSKNIVRKKFFKSGI